MTFTPYRALIMAGLHCAAIGLVCLLVHAFTPATYLGLIGIVMGIMAGCVAWDTAHPAVQVREIATEIKKELDNPKV